MALNSERNVQIPSKFNWILGLTYKTKFQSLNRIRQVYFELYPENPKKSPENGHKYGTKGPNIFKIELDLGFGTKNKCTKFEKNPSSIFLVRALKHSHTHEQKTF